MAKRLLIDSVAIAPSTRTPIVASVDCVEVRVTQTDKANDAKVWDASSGGFSFGLARGAQKTFAPPLGPALSRDRAPFAPGYKAGDTVCYIEAVAGTGPIAVEFTL